MKGRYKVDRARWEKFSIFDQMGNIYSEVGRSLNAKNKTEHDQAMMRAIDLFNATIYSVRKSKPYRAKEIRRAKQQFLVAANGIDTTKESLASLDDYFLQFAIAARLRH